MKHDRRKIFAWTFFALLMFLIVSGEMLYLSRNVLLTKYNVRPVKICSEYLEKTYGKKFTLCQKNYYKYNGYHIWELTYRDGEDMEFYEYYLHPMEGDGFYYTYFDKGFREDKVRDYYWQAVLREEYKSEWDIQKYEVYFDGSYEVLTHCFEIEKEQDIKNAADMISRLYVYTLNHVREISPRVIRCKVICQEKTLYAVWDEWMEFTEEEEIYQFVYDEIVKGYDASGL